MEYLIFVMKSRDLITCWSYVRLYIQSLCNVKGNHLNEHVVCNKSIDLKSQAFCSVCVFKMSKILNNKIDLLINIEWAADRFDRQASGRF